MILDRSQHELSGPKCDRVTRTHFFTLSGRREVGASNTGKNIAQTVNMPRAGAYRAALALGPILYTHPSPGPALAVTAERHAPSTRLLKIFYSHLSSHLQNTCTKWIQNTPPHQPAHLAPPQHPPSVPGARSARSAAYTRYPHPPHAPSAPPNAFVSPLTPILTPKSMTGARPQGRACAARGTGT